MTGLATISAPDEAGRATWHHAFSIRFSQITCLPCPSDDWTSNQRAGRGRQSNLTSCLFHQILSNYLPSLSIRWLDQRQSARRTRPAEQLDIMPFPSDSLKLLAFLVHQMTGPATISAPDEASRATWHDAFSISQIPSNDMWGWGNQRENQSGLASRSNLLSRRDENFIFYMILQMFIIIKELLRIVTYTESWHALGRSLKVSASLCFACPSDEVRTALVAPETRIATWHDGIT